MRISDWSSDVCSSDLGEAQAQHQAGETVAGCGRFVDRLGPGGSLAVIGRHRVGHGETVRLDTSHTKQAICQKKLPENCRLQYCSPAVFAAAGQDRKSVV